MSAPADRGAPADGVARVVLITGAAGGIGRALTRRFADGRTGLVLVDRNADGLAALAQDLDDPPTILTETVDITEDDAVDALVTRVQDRWGAVDVLVNNAAYAYDDDLLGTTPARWDEQVAIALRSVFLCSRAVLPGMRRRGRGVIVNMASVNAHQYFGNEAYSAAKAGVESLTRSIAVRYGPDGVRALALGIGTVLTPGAWDARLERDPDIVDRLRSWYPMRRLGTPEDIAALTAFVASDEASWITGTTIMVDGGLTAGNLRLAEDVLGIEPGGPPGPAQTRPDATAAAF
ncbi:SDR family NAD(P)-dependent oxidoreductase [Occultella kanbiaonis]|uniref:SDR family NAD(P)-dependent oxidoreductase n=1 Tax=Occultella kanbiaonis TaxID=2675754 RepID=UPI0012B948F5|nr:SDR family oxidoreductase [Occultella kanbiaonis]